MIITLDNKTNPTVEILNIDIEHNTVIFKNIDGVCSAPIVKTEADIPTEKELIISVESVLGEKIESIDSL